MPPDTPPDTPASTSANTADPADLRVLGCPLSLGSVPAGVRMWLVRRWCGYASTASSDTTSAQPTSAQPTSAQPTSADTGTLATGARTYGLRVQMAADEPKLSHWRHMHQQSQQQNQQHDRVLSILGQQVHVGRLASSAAQPEHTGSDSGYTEHTEHVRIESSGTVVWLALSDQHATLTLDTNLDTQDTNLDTQNTQNNHQNPDSQLHSGFADIDLADIDLSAAERGVWQGDVSPYPLVIALHEALRMAGWVPVHGACAQSLEGAVLFLGASGTGKTTTLVRALQAGWGFVAEDVLWVDAETLAVRSLEQGVRLFAEEVTRLEPRLAGTDLGELIMGKAFIAKETLADLYGASVTEDTRLRQVVQLVRDTHHPLRSSTPESSTSESSESSPSVWQTLSKQQAAVALWQGVGLPLTPQVQQRVAGWLPRWLEQVSAWQLTLGSDVREVLAAGMPAAEMPAAEMPAVGREP